MAGYAHALNDRKKAAAVVMSQLMNARPSRVVQPWCSRRVQSVVTHKATHAIISGRPRPAAGNPDQSQLRRRLVLNLLARGKQHSGSGIPDENTYQPGVRPKTTVANKGAAIRTELGTPTVASRYVACNLMLSLGSARCLPPRPDRRFGRLRVRSDRLLRRRSVG